MTKEYEQAYNAATAADQAWHAELVKAFGRRDAGDARYEKRGRGVDGSLLRLAHDQWESAQHTLQVTR